MVKPVKPDDGKDGCSAVLCLECGTLLISTFRHDYRTCACPNQTMVDGGNDYLRCGGASLSKVIEVKRIVSRPLTVGQKHDSALS